jgi:peptidoglycan/LPS O-acetylase OafA/YrhL
MMFDGASAVGMFFVLSGFVLTHPHLAPAPDGHRPRSLFIPTFYLRRIARIWPPWFAAFVVSALARKYFFGAHTTIPPVSEWLHGFWHFKLSASSVLRQCVFQQHNSGQMLIPQDWSLGVELGGSALIPLFLFLVRRSVPGFVGFVIVLMIFHSTGYWYASIALGVWAAKYYHRVESSLRSLSVPLKWTVLSVGVLFYESRVVASHFWEWSDTLEQIVWCLGSIGCVLILAASLSSRRIQARLNLPPVLLLGKISYSVYLLQFILILCLVPPLVRQLNLAGIQQAPLLLPLALLIGVLSTVALSVLMYYAVERPSIELGRWLTKFIQGRMAKRPPMNIRDAGSRK